MSQRYCPRRITLSAVLVLAVVLTVAFAHHQWWGGRESRLAGSDDPSDRLAAVELLRDRQAGWAMRLVRRLAADADERVAVQAIRAMGLTTDEEGCALLVGLMNGAESARIRGEAAAAAGPHASIADDKLVARLTDDPDPQVRAGAAKGLGHRKTAAAASALLAALGDGDQRVRLQAINAINRFVLWRTDYRAELPASQQRRQIQTIESLLRQEGLL
jgi:HEAT repeat protein